jgi:dTDP-4-dehydrorhamnose reductase
MQNTFDRIVITGGGGMLAQALVRSLRARGNHVVTLNRAACNVANESDVYRAFMELKPTLLINCAAYTKVDQAEQEPDLAEAVNGFAVGTLARLSKQYETALVHYSTDFVFDGTATRPYRPDAPVNPLSTYGRTKLLGERELQASAPPRWTIIRTAWLYGPGGPSFPQTMLNVARAGKPLAVVNDQVGSPTFTHDLADATLELIDRSATGIWHVVNAGQTTWFGFAAAIFEEFGVSPVELSPTTSAAWKQARPASAIRPAYSVLDTAPYERLVGKPMTHWREALRAYRNVVEPR